MLNIGELLKGKKEEILTQGQLAHESSDIYKSVDLLYQQLEDLQEFYDELREEQSRIDLAISDVEHFIEISNNLNAAEGYNMYKMLRDLLRQRREIKDAIFEVQPLINSIQPRKLLKYKQSTMDRVRETVNSNTSERHYNTRVLNNIFGDKIQNK